MALVANHAALGALRQQLATIARGDAMRVLTSRLTEEVKAQVLRELTEKRDPYGKPWAARKKQPAWAALAFGPATWPLLEKTQRLIRSVRVRPLSRGVKMTMVDYANYHQTGTAKMPARMLAPDASRGLGAIWQRGIEDVATRLLTQMLGAR